MPTLGISEFVIVPPFFHANHSNTEARPSPTIEKVRYKRRVSRVLVKCSATKKRRTPGRRGALNRKLLPMSSDTKVDNAVANRKATTAIVSGDQLESLALELVTTESVPKSAKPIS
jgi:hypothetical protein